jgi:hypothetical protein
LFVPIYAVRLPIGKFLDIQWICDSKGLIRFGSAEEVKATDGATSDQSCGPPVLDRETGVGAIRQDEIAPLKNKKAGEHSPLEVNGRRELCFSKTRKD